MLSRQFFALTHQAKATSMVQLDEAIVFLTIFPKMPLCLSHTPFDHGASAAVVIISVFRFSPISRKSRFEQVDTNLATLNSVISHQKQTPVPLEAPPPQIQQTHHGYLKLRIDIGHLRGKFKSVDLRKGIRSLLINNTFVYLFIKFNHYLID